MKTQFPCRTRVACLVGGKGGRFEQCERGTAHDATVVWTGRPVGWGVGHALVCCVTCCGADQASCRADGLPHCPLHISAWMRMRQHFPCGRRGRRGLLPVTTHHTKESGDVHRTNRHPHPRALRHFASSPTPFLHFQLTPRLTSLLGARGNVASGHRGASGKKKTGMIIIWVCLLQPLPKKKDSYGVCVRGPARWGQGSPPLDTSECISGPPHALVFTAHKKSVMSSFELLRRKAA